MKTLKATVLMTALLLSVPAVGCVGWLVRSENTGTSLFCTYRLSDNSLVRVVYNSNVVFCPQCLE
mgnify:CR=1 FL=1